VTGLPAPAADRRLAESVQGRRQPFPSVEDALLDLVHVGGGPIPRLTEGTWSRLAGLAVREQIWPLVFAAIQSRPGAEVPAGARAALEQSTQRTAAYVRAAYEQLAAALKGLREAGVTPALIKGAALARFAYTDAALRPFSDLDVLIPARDRAATGRALAAAGYVTAGTDRRVLEEAGEQTYWDPSWRRAPIDVHWRFDAAPVCLGLDYEAILRRAGAQTIGTEPVLLLSPADTLVALCAHFVKHLWGGQPRLRYLRDIAEVARRLPVDWDRVMKTAVEAPMTRSPLRNALSAAARVTGAPIPADVISRLAPSRGVSVDRRLTALTCRRILRRQTWPFPAVVQIAAMRWLDKDTWEIYPKLGRAVASMRWHRIIAAAGGRSRSAWPPQRHRLVPVLRRKINY